MQLRVACPANPRDKNDLCKQCIHDNPLRLFPPSPPGVLVGNFFSLNAQDTLKAREFLQYPFPSAKQTLFAKKTKMPPKDSRCSNTQLLGSATAIQYPPLSRSQKQKPLKRYLTLHDILYNAFPKRTFNVRARRTQIFHNADGKKTPRHIHRHTSNILIPFHSTSALLQRQAAPLSSRITTEESHIRHKH